MTQSKPKRPQKPSTTKCIEVKKTKFISKNFGDTLRFFALSVIPLLFLFNAKDLSSGVQIGLGLFGFGALLAGIYSLTECFREYSTFVNIPKSQKEIEADNAAYTEELAWYEKELKEYNKALDEDRKRKEEVKRKAEAEKAEKKRLEELKYEFVTIVKASTRASNNKYSATIKRSNNTYADIERANSPFNISEPLKLLRDKCNTFSWYSEEVYRQHEWQKEQKALKLRQQAAEKKRRSEYLDSFGIEYLYHMTHKNNLRNILRNGLKSHNHARTNGLTQVDIADNQVNDRRARLEPIYNRSIHDYVPLYFNPKNPMLYRRGNLQNDIVILGIDRTVLYQPDIIFTNGNAAANATSFFSNPNDLGNLNWGCINAEYWNDIPDGKRIKCSEVLVFPDIPIKAILKVFCNNQQTKQFAETLLTNHSSIEAEVKPILYFSGFTQQNNISQFNQSPRNYTSHDPIDDLPF